MFLTIPTFVFLKSKILLGWSCIITNSTAMLGLPFTAQGGKFVNLGERTLIVRGVSITAQGLR